MLNVEYLSIYYLASKDAKRDSFHAWNLMDSNVGYKGTYHLSSKICKQ